MATATGEEMGDQEYRHNLSNFASPPSSFLSDTALAQILPNRLALSFIYIKRHDNSPEDNFAVVDLDTAIDMDGLYEWNIK